MMLGRKLKTLLPTKTVRSKYDSEYHKQRQQKREAIRNTYNRGAKNLKPIAIGNPVFYRTPQDTWGPGKVISNNDRNYKILGENGMTYTRNRIHIRPKFTPFNNDFEASILSTIPRTSDSEDNPPEATTGQRRSERLRARPQWMKDYVT
ncbi:transposon Ty3-I Gag-Pol polyprotein [Elysia marginata]|uniref:Transposon Ty3-I Gag-Pol polyprotein n=1 Tax=Elysia marginata TaxID=1093978 RepID=A0AAV4J3L9_9GAST|nr:transposon Ty3-I Gag-Pol polyprotein [Elysia marginata]